MHPLAHYALLGSLIAAAAGALVLVAVTLRHGLKRRDASDADVAPDEIARRQRTLRLADTVAVLCFAVSAGLGVVGLMQQTRVVAPAVAATDDRELVGRVEALEKRLASTELELQTRAAGAPEWRAWEDRIERLESRIGAVENRVAVAQRRVPAVTPRAVTPSASPPSVSTPRPAAPAKPVPAPSRPADPPPSASPRLAPSIGDATDTPEVVASPRGDRSAGIAAGPPIPPAAVAPSEPIAPPASVAPRPPVPAPVAAAPRAATRPRAEPRPEEDASLADKIRRDWETVKQHARRGGEEWRDGWDRLKRLFGH